MLVLWRRLQRAEKAYCSAATGTRREKLHLLWEYVGRRCSEIMSLPLDSPAVIDICSFCGEPSEIPKRFLLADGDPEGAVICQACLAACQCILNDDIEMGS
jgi:hypothetical protein